MRLFIQFHVVKHKNNTICCNYNTTHIACCQANSRCVSPCSKIAGSCSCLQREDRKHNFLEHFRGFCKYTGFYWKKITLNYSPRSNSAAILPKAFHLCNAAQQAIKLRKTAGKALLNLSFLQAAAAEFSTCANPSRSAYTVHPYARDNAALIPKWAGVGECARALWLLVRNSLARSRMLILHEHL